MERPPTVDEGAWAKMDPQVRKIVHDAWRAGEKAGEERANKRHREQNTTLLSSLLHTPKRRRQNGAADEDGDDDGAASAGRMLLARVAALASQTFVLSSRLQKLQQSAQASAEASTATIESFFDAAAAALQRAIHDRRGEMLCAVGIVAQRQRSTLAQVPSPSRLPRPQPSRPSPPPDRCSLDQLPPPLLLAPSLSLAVTCRSKSS